jgi:proteasome lid subunit RPN8/RPN11
MPASSIQIPRTLVNQILHYAQSSPELEVCGLIGAREGMPASCYPVANCAETPQIRFRLEAQGQIAALRLMRERGESLFAIFHSHPHAPALPSPADLAEAAYPEALYLVISLDTKGVLEMRGFHIGPSQGADEVALLLGQD